ncbi:Cox-15 [Aphelenchoides fujianensis]|nr:Cox-15 [Aphelenchoides fujianensis]
MISNLRTLLAPKKVTELLLTSRIVQKWPSGQTKRLFSQSVEVASNVTARQQKTVGYWLLGCAGLVYGAVAIGGLTRTTESGLSMVDWDLFRSMKPPMNEADWEREFEKYKQFPEYQYKDAYQDMTMTQFKFIWTMEYFHRMWGRGIGIAFFLPAAYFWYKGRFNGPMKARMGIAGSLILLQGFVGWWMVKSGLDPAKNSRSDVPRVSQYRLTTHLGLAFTLYALFLWNGLSHVMKPSDHSRVVGIGPFRGLVHGVKAVIFLTAIMGGFVAGLEAGVIYNEWPKFAGRWVPHEILEQKPFYRNFTENPVTVQFLHRHLAYLTLFSVTLTWLKGRRLHLDRRARIALHSLLIAGYGQAVLGISTLIYYSPVWLCALHQNGGMALLTAAFWLSHEIRRLPK